jgi:hypothetical protein
VKRPTIGGKSMPTGLLLDSGCQMHPRAGNLRNGSIRKHADLISINSLK